MESVNGAGQSNDISSRLPLPYLRQITGYMGRQLTKERHADQYFLDHSYSKPWNSHPFASRTKPARLLFFTYPSKSLISPEPSFPETIDVEGSIQQSCLPPYDMIKAKSQMNEWESHLSNISIEDVQDDWEEQINRIGWTVPQNRLFAKVTKILHGDCLAKLAYTGSSNEPVLRRIYVDKGAKRLRQVFASFHWDFTLLQWLHTTLLDNLSVSYLAEYLDMLQTLKAKVPALVNKIIATASSNTRSAVTGPETSAFWNRRPWDPILPSLSYNKLKKLPGSPLILMVPFAPSQGICNQTKRMRFWLSQLANMGKVIPVTMYAPGGGRSAIVSQCMEHMMGATRTKINELKDNFPNRPIILMGWGVGSLLACYVALQERVAAVVCLGFQMTGLKGIRGDVDDPILENRVPTLFVIGQNSPISKIDDVEEFREKMKTETSLVIVGGADEWLRINHYKKKEEGITQTVVDRCLLDEISNFLGATLTSLPFQTPDIYGNVYYGRNHGPHQPVARENKRKKRKLDTIVEFDDEGGVEAPATKWKATSLMKTEHKQNNYPVTTLAGEDVKPVLPSENMEKDLTPITETPVKSAVKNITATGKRSYVRRTRVHIPTLPESTSSDSSSTSFVSSNKSSYPDKEVEETIVSSPLVAACSPNPVTTLPKGSNSKSLTFNIGFLSSLGQMRRNQTGQSTPKQSPISVVKRNPEPKSTPTSEFNPPTSTTSVLHLYKALSNPSGKSTPVSIYSMPARSAFSVPKAGVKPTIGISSMTTCATGFKMNVPSPSIINSSIVDQPTKQQVEDTRNQQSRPLEPDQEQVQAIQKLQFHDFPLTTASLTKTTTGVSVTQAKILSKYNLDFKKLQNLTTASGVSTTSVVVATTARSAKNTIPSISEVRKDNKGDFTSQTTTLSNPITSYTFSAIKSTTADKKVEGIRVREIAKRSPLSVIVLKPSKVKEVEEIVVTDDAHLQGNEKCLIDAEISDEPKGNLPINQNPEFNEVPVEDSMSVDHETVFQVLEVGTSVSENTSTRIPSSSDTVEDGEKASTSEDVVQGSEILSEIITHTNTSPSRGKFKAPTFPTIAATRTRRIRTPKYMYYDL